MTARGHGFCRSFEIMEPLRDLQALQLKLHAVNKHLYTTEHLISNTLILKTHLISMSALSRQRQRL